MRSQAIALLMFSVALTAVGWSQAPVPIQAMNDLPNAAQLYIVYCSPLNVACVTRTAICYGQCGNQYEADNIGYACSGDLEGSVPFGFHYERWFAINYRNSKKISGLATKGFRTQGCHNSR